MTNAWKNLPSEQQGSMLKSIREQLADEYELENFDGQIVVLDYVFSGTPGWECDTQYLMLRVDGVLELRCVDSVSYRPDQIENGLKEHIVEFENMAADVRRFLANFDEMRGLK